MELETIRFPLRETISETARLLGVEAIKKRLSFSCEIAPDVPTLAAGDPVRLRQVITNLLGNAIKFTQRGEVSLRVLVDEATSTAVVLRFEFRDTGIGIPPEKLPTIFEPFTQGDNTVTRHFGGTGLGLSIAARIVEKMHGEIWVESEVGLGSAFYFTVRLGAVTDSVADPVPSHAEAPFSQPPLNVLVTEDNPVNQCVASRLLAKFGHTVVLANSGKQAIEAFQRQRFDVILMDIQMPEMDGYEAAAAIRALERNTQHTPIIAVTAHAMKGDRERCIAAGMDGYVTKPIHPAELRAALQAAVAVSLEPSR